MILNKDYLKVMREGRKRGVSFYMKRHEIESVDALTLMFEILVLSGIVYAIYKVISMPGAFGW